MSALKEHRQQKGITKEEIAEDQNVSLPTVRRWALIYGWKKLGPGRNAPYDLEDVLKTFATRK